MDAWNKNWSRDHNGFAAKACATLTVSDVQFVIASEGRVRQSFFGMSGWQSAWFYAYVYEIATSLSPRND